jgi:hypothetical protein
MLERYYFLADVLSLALALSLKNRTAIFTACAVQMASFLSLLTLMHFFYRPFPALVGALCAGAALVSMCRLARPTLKVPISRNRPAFG